MRRLRAAARSIGPAAIAILGLIVVAGLVLRLRNNGYGLPYVYNVDEGSHFTSRAVAMFGGDPKPGYFQNPSGFTYLVFAALWLRDLLPFGSFGDVVELFKNNPSEIYQTARA